MDHALDHVVADAFLLLKTYLGHLGTMDYGPMDEVAAEAREDHHTASRGGLPKLL